VFGIVNPETSILHLYEFAGAGRVDAAFQKKVNNDLDNGKEVENDKEDKDDETEVDDGKDLDSAAQQTSTRWTQLFYAIGYFTWFLHSHPLMDNNDREWIKQILMLVRSEMYDSKFCDKNNILYNQNQNTAKIKLYHIRF